MNSPQFAGRNLEALARRGGGLPGGRSGRRRLRSYFWRFYRVAPRPRNNNWRESIYVMRKARLETAFRELAWALLMSSEFHAQPLRRNPMPEESSPGGKFYPRAQAAAVCGWFGRLAGPGGRQKEPVKVLHFALDGRRTEPSRYVRPQAGGKGPHPRRVSDRSTRRFPGLQISEHFPKFARLTQARAGFAA